MSIQRYGFDSFGPSHPGGVLIPAPAGQYVLYDDHLAAVAEVTGLSDEAIYNDGFAAGVAAARDAVAAVPLVMAFTGELAIIRQPVALAAIDALRKDK